MSELNNKKMQDEEQQLIELFNLECSKLRILRNTQSKEEEERRVIAKELAEKRTLEDTTKKMSSIIARASKEDMEEEAQVNNFNLILILRYLTVNYVISLSR